MEVHTYSVKAKSQAGNKGVKYIMATQKGQSRKKSARNLRNLIWGIYASCWKFSRGSQVQERMLLGLCIYF